MAEEVKRIDIKEFQETGFLQEVNRQFFHPLGLALEVIIDTKGNVKLGGIWDYRDDPEGLFFKDDGIDVSKIERVKRLKDSKRFERYMAAKKYGVALGGDSIQKKV